MAAIINNFFGGSKPSASPIVDADSDFADFDGSADPSPVPFSAIPSAASFGGVTAAPTGAAVPYTKWYNVHERHSLSEFKHEGIILIAILILATIHIIGARANRSKAKEWIGALAPALEKEFALVGYGGRKAPTVDDVESEGLLKSVANDSLDLPVQLMKEKSLNEFATYATGRQNIAFVDINLTLLKRHNPISTVAETALNFFINTIPAPVEQMTAISYTFDGKEALTVPGYASGTQELRSRDSKSGYDGFVWAIVNKDIMKTLRDDRYDVSITVTKDSTKLPIWVTVMSESAEVTDLLLTPELVKAIEQAGELLDYIIISDQPIDKPLTLNETTPKKRLFYSSRLPTTASGYSQILPLFEYFLKLPDILAQSAHFRPEVTRKIRQTREDLAHKLQKADEDVKAEERAGEREKAKKTKRDLELKGLDAKAQKKYLEKEREKEQRKMQKRQTQRA